MFICHTIFLTKPELLELATIAHAVISSLLMLMKNSPIPFLRLITLTEAVSLLVLLLIAMPLKYMAGMPMAVKIVGWIHGVLFVTFCFALLRTILQAKWSIFRATLIFVAALLPAVPFFIDRRMKGYEKEFQRLP